MAASFTFCIADQTVSQTFTMRAKFVSLTKCDAGRVKVAGRQKSAGISQGLHRAARERIRQAFRREVDRDNAKLPAFNIGIDGDSLVEIDDSDKL